MKECRQFYIDGKWVDPVKPHDFAVPNPATRSPVDQRNNAVHRIKTQSGIYMDLVDEDRTRA